MYRKLIFLVSFIMVLSLSASVQAATVTFHATAPTPGPYDIYNLVGASRDANNVGTYDYDTWLNNETTYIADDRPAQGQTFVTGSSEPVYLLTGVWIRHCGYTDSTSTGTTNNGTWCAMPAGSEFGIRITDPAASSTSNFILGSEAYTVTRTEPNISLIPASATGSANGTGTWIHFVLDTPIVVAPNTIYGFDVVSVAGGSNMFFEMLGIKIDSLDPPGNPYTAGTAYTSGGAGVANNTLTVAPGDRVFVVELVGAPPASASIPYPANNATGVETAPVLRWNAGFDSTQSKVYFGTSPDSLAFQTTITHTESVDRYSYPVTGLAFNQVYYWRVDQVPQTGPEIMGDVWSFTIGTTKASNPNPYVNEICVSIDPNPSLSWKAGLYSTESKVYFGTSPDALELQTTITHTQGVDRVSFPVTGLANDQDYYWRVDQVPQTGPDVIGDLWQFTTIPTIPITDPTLVGWWKFDEGPGKAIDWSGLNQHGTVYGDAESMAGYDGNAMQFDGSDDYVNLPIGTTIASSDSTTIATWANVSSTAAWQRIFDFGFDPPPGPNAPTIYMYLTPVNGSGVPEFGITTTGSGGTLVVAAPSALPSGWHHLAVTIDGTTNAMELYLDGAAVATSATQTLPSDLGMTPDNYLGKSKRWENASGVPDPHFTGSLDDFRIYNYALTQDEILKIMRGGPLLSWNPRPANGVVTDVEKALPLSWSPGDEAVQHDVYFGTDYAAVEAADASDTTGIYRGQQDANSYTPPEGVEPNHAYYWRINEINTDATVSKGRIWSFTVADYLIVDDFEDYEDIDNRIFDIWVDYFVNNTGMTVGYFDPPYAEQTIVHGGSQSMYMRYDNDGTVNEGTDYEQSGTLLYSEAERTWEIPQDWTREGVESLMLWFRGIPASVGSFTAGPPIMMTAAGADIWGTADQFYFAYKRLSGGGSITARVVSVSNTDPWAKAGVMIRESLEPSSVNVMIAVTPGNGVTFQNRTSAGADSVSTVQAGITAPQWVRLTRSGNTFTADYSATGTANSWTTLGNIEMPMATDVYIGLCLTSHNVGATCTTEFSNVNITGTVTGDWQSQDIGIESNIAEQLYVVLEDSAGSSAVVNNSDPAATTIGIWTEWNIPLTDFAGVNMQAIKKMIIGVGDPSSPDPQPGGAGTLYIDDIGLKLPIQ